MEKSESLKNLATALVKFNGMVGKIGKGSTNPFFKSKYAALPDILTAINGPLAECGLTINQFPSGQHGLTTILIHAESGEFLMDTYTMAPAKNDPQGIGSCITYQRRYAIGAALSLNIDEDDDGNSATHVKEPSTSEKVNGFYKAPKSLSDGDLKEIKESLSLINDMEEFKKYFKNLTKDIQTDPKALELFKVRKEELEFAHA